jgi:hypothetical protein
MQLSSFELISILSHFDLHGEHIRIPLLTTPSNRGNNLDYLVQGPYRFTIPTNVSIFS